MDSFAQRLIHSLRHASQYDPSLMQPPQAVLWPDPERQWAAIIPLLREKLPELLTLGTYTPEQRQGPAIWLKCMVAASLDFPDWPPSQTPLIYLPGISRQQLKNLSQPLAEIAPLQEYLYSGSLWLHRNGKEWTVSAFLQNREEGMGLNLAQDQATKEAALSALPRLMEEPNLRYPTQLNSEFLYALLFADPSQAMLDWLSQQGEMPAEWSDAQRGAFVQLCQKRYQFMPRPSQLLDVVRLLAARKNDWATVWQRYATAPAKYPAIEPLLRQAHPQDGQSAQAGFPSDAWPLHNEAQEEQLRQALRSLTNLPLQVAETQLLELEHEHGVRRAWVWAELGQAPLAQALLPIKHLVQIVQSPIEGHSLPELTHYYRQKGFRADYAVLQILALGHSHRDREALHATVLTFYQPWLETLTHRFQTLLAHKPNALAQEDLPQAECLLFVDAFRYDIASAFVDQLPEEMTVELSDRWSALPSLTPTAKPAVSPVASFISPHSQSNDFRPQLMSGADLTPYHFKQQLESIGYHPLSIKDIAQAQPGEKYWIEIGDIDRAGHQEQERLARRIPELFAQVEEVISELFSCGIKDVQIVTDHGWLLLPGGLPKAELPKQHAETRWGRCAVLKEGVPSELLHLPWHWNPHVHIAYAPGISFFKRNEAYAHGGLSVQECLTPVISIRQSQAKRGALSIQAKWVGLRCRVTVRGALAGDQAVIRTQYAHAESNVSSPKPIDDAGKASLLVADDSLEGTGAFVIVQDARGIILTKISTIIGENP